MLNLPALKSWWYSGANSSSPPPTADSLDAFGPERSPTAGWNSDPLARWRTKGGLVIIALAVLAVAGLSGYALRTWSPFKPQAASASLTIESEPAGAEILSEGASRGKTPLTLSVPPGQHSFELVLDGRRKILNATTRAGAVMVHYVQFDSPAAVGPAEASLRITTEPSRLRVTVDGVSRGVSPLTLSALEAGVHKVQVAGTSGTIERKVEIAAGETASVMITASTPKSVGPAAGWLTVKASVPLQVSSGTDVIGTSQSARIMLPVGKHELHLTNESLGFSVRRVVQVTAGASSNLNVDLPSAPLSINAVPWAEAWIDGKRIGETPIGNHLVRLGTHEVVLRHPELGERRQSIVVTMTAPARVSVDMRKPGS
ncbi:MAG: PEGA domain-containing protein [Acidobacteria bacterium]|nr:PEGA domain-containing protein [Acidobacteriota bacterium]